MNDIHPVRRLSQVWTGTSQVSFDGVFTCEDMASSKMEGPALSESLERIRAAEVQGIKDRFWAIFSVPFDTRTAAGSRSQVNE